MDDSSNGANTNGATTAAQTPVVTMASTVCRMLMNKGLLVVPTGANVIRFLPPLFVTEEQIAAAVRMLEEVLEELSLRETK